MGIDDDDDAAAKKMTTTTMLKTVVDVKTRMKSGGDRRRCVNRIETRKSKRKAAFAIETDVSSSFSPFWRPKQKKRKNSFPAEIAIDAWTISTTRTCDGGDDDGDDPICDRICGISSIVWRRNVSP